MSILSKPCFHDEAAAFEHVEFVLWPEGPVCPFCGGVNSASKLAGVRSKPSAANPEGAAATAATLKWMRRSSAKIPTLRRASAWRLGRSATRFLTLIDRRTGQAGSVVINDLKSSTIGPIVQANVAYDSRILTDEAPRLRPVGGKFAVHKRVNHAAEEWVSKEDRTIHTNTVENYFSVFKRGMKGTYQHCSKNHLHRYLVEFDYRYNHRSANGIEDGERAAIVLRGVVAKRLMYRRPDLLQSDCVGLGREPYTIQGRWR